MACTRRQAKSTDYILNWTPDLPLAQINGNAHSIGAHQGAVLERTVSRLAHDQRSATIDHSLDALPRFTL